jgi:hypothetical protein
MTAMRRTGRIVACGLAALAVATGCGLTGDVGPPPSALDAVIARGEVGEVEVKVCIGRDERAVR